MLALVDCDCFYVSCERVFDPSLKNKPVAVLSNNDGCVVARSEEMKNIGVKMGAPYFKVKDVIKKNNGVVFSSNYELYGNMSKRVMSILNKFSPDVEVYSIDEAFIRLNDNLDYIKSAVEIVKTIKQWTGIPVKIGVGPTKTICKIAAELVKKRKIKEKYYILNDPELIKYELNSFCVGDIWGIGRKTAGKLNNVGIKTAAQLVRYGSKWAKNNFGINLERTVLELNGTKCFSLENSPQPKKSLCFSRSFGKAITSYREMKESVVYYAEHASENLRKDHQLASAVSVYVTTNFFKKTGLQYSNSSNITLQEQSNSCFDIVEAAVKCLDFIYKKGFRYKKSGVLLYGLVSEGMSQGNLFSKQNIKKDKASSVIDIINRQYGSGTIKLAGEGINKKEWEMQRGKLSRNYTSNWDDLLKVK